jgi:hypothetical protein
MTPGGTFRWNSADVEPRFLEERTESGKSFICEKPFLAGNVLMDAEKMLEIIETRAWFPKKSVDKQKTLN